MAYWEDAIKKNPRDIESMLEIAQRLRVSGQLARPHHLGDAQIERGVQLCERAFALEQWNGYSHSSLSLALKEGTHHFRQSVQAKAQVLWGKLSSLVDQGIALQSKQRFHDPFVTNARKWKEFTEKLGKGDEKEDDTRCLGRVDEWSLGSWEKKRDAKRIDTSDSEAMQNALKMGSAEPVILTGGSKPNFSLDDVLAKNSGKLAEVTITHEKGLAMRFESITPWKRNAAVDREYTSHTHMNADIRAEAAAHGGAVASKVVVRGAATHMMVGDFMRLSSQPAFKKGEAKPSRPNLYLIAGNLQVGVSAKVRCCGS